MAGIQTSKRRIRIRRSRTSRGNNTEELNYNQNQDQAQSQAPDRIPTDIPPVLLQNPHPCHRCLLQQCVVRGDCMMWASGMIVMLGEVGFGMEGVKR